MRVPVSFIAALVLAGCNSLLGITDPKAAHDDDVPHDAPVDVHTESGDRVEITIGDFSLAIQQATHLHAKIVHKDGSSGDITAQATWTTGDVAIAFAATTPGEIDGIASGSTSVTASLGDATPASIVATVTDKACHVTINEVQAGGALSAGDEWIEVINPCVSGIDLSGLRLVYRAASATGSAPASDTNQMVSFATETLASGQLHLYAGPNFPGAKDGGWNMGLMQANSGAVAIRDATDAIIDSVAYGDCDPGHPFIEKAEAPGLTNGKSVARLPFDGHDLDDNSTDFVLVDTPTPHASNVK